MRSGAAYGSRYICHTEKRNEMTINPVLVDIIDHKRQEVDKLKKVYPYEALVEAANERSDARSLYSALKSDAPKVKVIAEIKRTSPTASFKPVNFDPAKIAKSYEAAGAVAISVLTDARFFSGAPSYVPMVRDSVSIPVLRKEFIIDPWQLAESAALGADAVLLMAVNFQDTSALEAMYNEAVDFGLEPLVEIHSKEEWEMVKPLAPKIVGINNRDFLSADLAVDISTSAKLAPLLPEETAIISESGISSKEQIDILSKTGVDGFLIGSSLMCEGEPGAQLVKLIG